MEIRGRDFIGVGVGGVVINDENKILMVLRNKSPEKECWSIPGGAVEFGEKLETAVIREIYEETGLECEVFDLLCITNQIIDSEKSHWVSITYLLVSPKVQPYIKEQESHAEMRWFNWDCIPNNVTIATLDAVRKLKQNSINAVLHK